MSHKPTGQNTGETQTNALEAGHADSPDTYFKILSNQRRRQALDCLQEYRNPMALSDLVDEVAIREYETRITEIPAEEVKEIYISLYHVHVPRMEDVGLVEYDQDTDLVALSEEGQTIIETHDVVE